MSDATDIWFGVLGIVRVDKFFFWLKLMHGDFVTTLRILLESYELYLNI